MVFLKPNHLRQHESRTQYSTSNPGDDWAGCVPDSHSQLPLFSSNLTKKKNHHQLAALGRLHLSSQLFPPH
jgi:hypothetical protein